MTTITKNLKLSLTAIAFILGIGAAFATQSSNNDAPPCDEVEVNGLTCQNQTQDPCCTDGIQTKLGFPAP